MELGGGLGGEVGVDEVEAMGEVVEEERDNCKLPTLADSSADHRCCTHCANLHCHSWCTT